VKVLNKARGGVGSLPGTNFPALAKRKDEEVFKQPFYLSKKKKGKGRMTI